MRLTEQQYQRLCHRRGVVVELPHSPHWSPEARTGFATRGGSVLVLLSVPQPAEPTGELFWKLRDAKQVRAFTRLAAAAQWQQIERECRRLRERIARTMPEVVDAS